MFQNIKKMKLAAFIAASFFILGSSCYATAHFSVYPPTSAYAGTDGNGSTVSITDVQPGSWVENGDIVTAFGSYSNKVYIQFINPGGEQCPYTLEIKLDSPTLTGPGGNTIPASSLKYMYSYGRNGSVIFPGGMEAPGNKGSNYQKYVAFSASPQTIYISLSGPSTLDVPAVGGSGDQRTRDWEHQFKYAIQAPDNTPPGTYTGTIRYILTPTIGSPIERTATINIVVTSIFSMALDRGTADFENMTPGETKDNVPVEGVIITTKITTGNPWYLKISNNSPLSSGPYVIPNNNLIWYGWTDGTGTWYGNGYDQMTFVPTLMYASSASEGMNSPKGTKNHLKFKLTIPKGQPGGKYLSTVKLTLTE